MLKKEKAYLLELRFSVELTQVSDTPSHVYQLAEYPQLNMTTGLVWLATEHTCGALSTFPLTTHNSSRSDSQVYNPAYTIQWRSLCYFFFGTIMRVDGLLEVTVHDESALQ